MFKRYAALLLMAVCALVMLGISAAASASTAAPGWEIFTRVAPTNLPPGGEGKIFLYVYNAGAGTGESPTVTDTLPEGLTATGGVQIVRDLLGEVEGGGGSECAVVLRVITCTADSVPPGALIEIEIPVNVAASVVSGSEAVNEATAVGGGALSPASESLAVHFGSTQAGFGIAGFDGWFTSADGMNDTQAGSHPYELTVVYSVNSKGLGGFEEFPTGGEARNLIVNLPPGIIGNPTAVPRCTRKQFDDEISYYESNKGGEHPTCPPSTQVGINQSIAKGRAVSFKVYNLVPPPGVAAQFAFDYDGKPVFLDAGVRSGGPTSLSNDYGISEHVDDIPEEQVDMNTTTIWGVPGEESHDAQREAPSGAGLTPFLTVPTSCEGPLEFSIELLNTWESESTTTKASFLTHDSTGTQTGMTGCDHMGFAPAISVAPDTGHADTPAGLTVDVEAPEQGIGTAEGLSTSDIKDTTVTLPAGVVINPGQAAGLVACQPSQDGKDGEGPPSCPLASKVGTVEIETPLLADKLQGDVYIMQSNPPELQLLVAASGDGVNLKLIGEVRLNEATGQLVTTFSETPQLPFTNFKLSFSGGAQAALATPTECGTYTTTSDFTPWSTPLVQDAFPSGSFAVESGPGGSACQDPLPFHPEMIAGATTDQAGGYTSFSLLLQRGDGQQRIGSLQFKTPEGLLGMISKVPLCGEQQANEGACPEASQIGHTVVTAGPGPYPLVVPEPGQPPAPIYLTGGYKGAPYGLSIVVPLVTGPFNLGKIVVRGRIEVDPHTAQLTVTTGPLPSIVKGIPADLRVIDAVIDKPGFMFNPTSCAPMSFSGTATSTEGTSVPISSHFQVGSCQALKFQPNFKVSTQGKTSRANGASLDAKIVYPTGNLGFNQASSQSNIQIVKVELPKRLPSRLSTLQKACTAQVFEANPANCPAASVIGHATALTPVLPVPLTGPAYFVSHGNEQFPSLIVVLQGYGVTVDLVGTTFISKTGITSSTFKQVPDVPIGSFELVLPEGPYSALAANGNLCKGSMTMPTEFTGQNGAFLKQSTKIAVTGCPRTKKTTVKHRKAKRKQTKAKKRAKTKGGKHARGGAGHG